jgi:Tol biopolymer transport system component
MKKSFFILLSAMLAMAVCSCSLDISQDTVATSTSPQTPPTIPFPIPTPAGSTQQGPTAIPSPTNPQIPVTWGSLNLSGKLVYVSGGADPYSVNLTIQTLDLASGEIFTIFQALENSWIYSFAVSADGKQLVIAYSPASDNNSFGYPELYVMPMDGSTPLQPLFTPPTKDDEYFQPDWSSDGKYIYFAHVNRTIQPKEGQLYPDFEVYRMAYPDGQLEKIADEAFWPRVSEDSTRLVYVSVDPTYGTNKLFLANADGSNAQNITMTGKTAPNYIDAPIFSPDGKSMLFSGLSLTQASSPTWLEKLFGITVAYAHSIPSDWWSVPLTGGTPIQLTHLQTTGLFASLSPDKKYLACISGSGLFVMNPDGTGLTMLVNNAGGIPGTISWIP